MKILVVACFTVEGFEHPWKVVPGGMEKFTETLIDSLIVLGHDVSVLAPLNTDITKCSSINIIKSRSYSSLVDGVKTRKSHTKRYEDILEVSSQFDLIIESNFLWASCIRDEKHHEWVKKTIFLVHTNYLPMRFEILACYNLKFLKGLGARTYTVSQDCLEKYERFPSKKAFVAGVTAEEWEKAGSCFTGTFLIHSTNVLYTPSSKPYEGKAVCVARNCRERRLSTNLKMAKKYGYHLTLYTDKIDGLKFDPSYSTIKIGVPHDVIMSELPTYDFAVSMTRGETTGISNFEYATYGLPVIHESRCSSEFLPIDYFGFHHLESVEELCKNHDYQKQARLIQENYNYNNYLKRLENLISGTN